MPSYFVEVWSLLGVKQNLSQAQIGLLYFRLSSLHCLFHMVVPTPNLHLPKKQSTAGEVKAVGHSTDSYIAPFNGIRIPERRKFLLVEYRIREIVALQLWNLEYSSRNPESHWRLQSRVHVPLTKTGIQYVESRIHSVESRIQDCPWFPYIRRAMINSCPCYCITMTYTDINLASQAI